MAGRHRKETRRGPLAPLTRDWRRRLALHDHGGRPSLTQVALLAAAGACGALLSSTVPGATGSALIAASAVLPAAWLGARALATGRALDAERELRRGLAGELAASDEQIRRLADRLDHLHEERADVGVALESARTGLRRARVEVATARAGIAGLREDLVRTRAQLSAAASSRDEARQAANKALADAERAMAAARRAESALQRVAGDRPDPQTDAPVESRPVRLVGQRSFASVDLRVFDAFAEADLDDVGAALDAPSRRGRHSVAAPAAAAASALPGAARPGSQAAGSPGRSRVA